jgi:hypothetical protein
LLYRYFCIAQQQVLFLFLIITLYYDYQLASLFADLCSGIPWGVLVSLGFSFVL